MRENQMREALKASEVALVNLRKPELSPEELEWFESCKVAHRFVAFVNKELVIYNLDNDLKPDIVDILTCIDAGMDPKRGMWSKWRIFEEVVEIGHTPVCILQEWPMFLWHTFHSEVQTSAHKGDISMRFSMLMSSQLRPDQKKPWGTYIRERAGFDLEF